MVTPLVRPPHLIEKPRPAYAQVGLTAPLPGPPIYQPSPWGALFHSLPYDEVLGAGSAGPGKSLTLLMEANAQIFVEHHRCSDPDHPYHLEWGESSGWALHLRRTSPMLDQTMARALRMFPLIDPGGRWEASKTTYHFSSGYRYQFGHCAEAVDWERYLSQQYTIIMYDELTQFDEEQYDQINTRCRSDDDVLLPMVKIRAMSTPMMRKEGQNFSVKDPHWVRKRFVDRAPEGKHVFHKTLIVSGKAKDYTWMYLPATLDDNPNKKYVEAYKMRLLNAKPHIRQALLYGNWYVTAGSFFGEVWNPRLHIVKPFRIPDDWARFRSMDWGHKAPGCIHWYATDPDGNLYVYRELTFRGKTATEVARMVKDIEEADGTWKGKRSRLSGPADTQLWEQRGDSAKGKAAEFSDAGVEWVPASKARQRNAEFITARLKDHGNGTMTPGLVFFTGCTHALRTLPAVQTSEKNSEEPMDGHDDHWLDSIMYGCAYASKSKRGTSVAEIEDKDDDWSDAPKPKEHRGRWGYGSKLC